MEANKQVCCKCKANTLLSIQYTCGHPVCSLCLSEVILIKHLEDLNVSDQLQITCSCNGGVLNLKIKMLLEILKSLKNPEDLYTVNKEERCTECEPWKQIRRNDLCRFRNMIGMSRDIYCKDCDLEIFYCCVLQGSSHYYHDHVRIEDYTRHLKMEIEDYSRNHLNLDDFTMYLNRIENQFKDRFNSNYFSTLNDLEGIIKALQDYREKYKETMAKRLEKVSLYMSVLRLLFSNFYSWLSYSKNSYDVHLLSCLKQMRFQLTDVNLSFNKDLIKSHIGKVWSHIEDLSDLIPNEHVSFKFDIVKAYYPRKVVPYHTGGVKCLIQLKNEKIVSGGTDSTIRIWEKEAFTCIQVLQGHDSWVKALVELPSGQFASCADDMTIKIWTEIKDIGFANTQTLFGHTGFVDSLILYNDNSLLSGSNDESIKLWTANSLGEYSCARTLTGHTGCIRALLLLKDSRILSGSDDKAIRVWTCTEKGDFQCTIVTNEHTRGVIALINLKNGRFASGSDEGTIRIWMIKDNQDFLCMNVLTLHTRAVPALVQLNDERLVSGSYDSTIRLWRINEKDREECVRLLEGHTGWVFCLLLLKDGRLVSGSDDKTLRIWD